MCLSDIMDDDHPCRPYKKPMTTELIMKKKNCNRFHVVVRLFSIRSQISSNCGKSQKRAREAVAEYITDVFTTFFRLL